MTAQFSRLGAVIFVCRNKHMKEFDEVFVDKTKYGTKLKTSDYKECGKYPIIDQGQETIAGYTDAEDGVFKEVPVIIFGDHTRVIKYVDKPFFLGADGVKVLRSKYLDANYRYLFYALLDLKIPNTGYNRHFKWLKEAKIQYPTLKQQEKVVGILDKIEKVIAARNKQLNALDELIQARFVEMFGDPVVNDKGWKIDTVEKLCKEIYGGGTPSKSHPEYYEDGNIPWVSSKDMKTDVLNDSQIKINQLGVDNSTARMVPVNSVIMVIRSGILKHTLPVAINVVPITVNQDLKVFIPNERLLTRFLAVQFKMHEKDILSGVRAVTADNIEFNSLKQRKLIVPPIELQQEFADFAHQVNKSKLVIKNLLQIYKHRIQM